VELRVSGPPLRIMTYNVRYFGHALGGLASTRPAMRRIAEAIARLDPAPDVVCLQEVETRSLRSTIAHRGRDPQLARFMEELRAALAAANRPEAYAAHYFPAHAYRLSETARIYTTGLAVLARSDLQVDHHNADSPHDITERGLHPIRGLKQTRICAHLRLRVAGSHGSVPLDVFNTHLSLPSTFARAFWTERRRLGFGPNQLTEAQNLARFVEHEAASDRFIVLGDFNALPGSPVYRFLVEERGWVDAFASCRSLSLAELERWPTAGFVRMRMHLDHVFAGPGMDWIDFEGSHCFGDRAGPFHGLSDHVPMIARCRASADVSGSRSAGRADAS
jgi:endonuclease/exonuclease/phosphatase family metal-dependent hydrolase